MLFTLLKTLLGGKSKRPPVDEIRESIDTLFEQGSLLCESGRLEEAIAKYQKVLDHDPYHVVAMNQVAVCLTHLKRDGEAGRYFERAALLDDSFAPALVNFAVHLNDNFHSSEAERYLRRAQEAAPDAAYIDGVFGAVKMLRGRPHEATTHQLNAWLKSFDELKFAHNYLFNHGFPSENTAESTAAEHLFWAETLDEKYLYSQQGASTKTDGIRLEKSKVRIGYLSPDFRKHSVRFFFRPLLENHDRDRFEIYGYYDMAWEDEQTRAIREKCDVFRDIANLPDEEVVRLLREDKLDILVELAGHTSVSRIHLFGNRLASVQMTALGYPPTTGLRSIDYKVVDLQTAPLGSEHLYAERLLRLPDSFWCFNPLEDTPEPAPLPYTRNGHITFGCFGNISKISRRVLACWAKIMGEVPDSRLILKAITFQDDEAKESIKTWLATAGIDLGRVRLDLPDPPEKLYAAYADVDIILDTQPFNGGTTSCFALWMGVPIVTLTGEALISRMGASMLHTLGLDDLIATNDEEYVAAAVRIANEHGRLGELRRSLRELMLSTPLGNGALYAHQFEEACMKVLADAETGRITDASAKPKSVLPELEVIRRAEFVLGTGQAESAQRIVNYCLRHYPNSAGARILRASIYERDGRLENARDYLFEALSLSASKDRQAIQINLVRLDLLLGRYEMADAKASKLLHEEMDDLGRLHLDLYCTAAKAWSTPSCHQVKKDVNPSFVSVIIHCGDDARVAAMRKNLSGVMDEGNFEIIRTQGESRISEYEQALKSASAEVLVFIRPELEILSTGFDYELAEAMTRYDVVGFSGADRLAGTRWFDAGFPHAHGAVILPASGQPGCYDLSIYGPTHRRFHDGLAVLDCGLFAVRKSVFDKIAFDRELDGEHGLCELDWCHRAFVAGYSLGAAPLLGVLRHGTTDHTGRNWHDCAKYFREKHDLPDTTHAVPIAGASILLKSPELALPVLRDFYLGCQPSSKPSLFIDN